MGTTWNPATLQTANGALSGGNLTYTKSANGDRALRSVHSFTSGTGYAELLLNGSDCTFGLLNGTPTLPATVDFFPGIDNNGISAVSDGRILLNGVALVATGGLGTQAVGQRVCIAWKWVSGTGLFWARIQGGSWNGSGTANPATDTGGISISALGTPGTTPLFLSTTTYISGGGSTLKSAASGWAFSPPAGYGEINSVAAVASQTIPAISQVATAAVQVSATASQAVPSFSQVATAGVRIAAAAAQAVPNFAQVATAGVRIAAAAAQAVPNFAQVATASIAGSSISAAAAQAVPDFTQAATVAVSIAATAAQLIPAFTQVATASGPVAQGLPGYRAFWSEAPRAVSMPVKRVAAVSTIPVKRATAALTLPIKQL